MADKNSDDSGNLLTRESQDGPDLYYKTEHELQLNSLELYGNEGTIDMLRPLLADAVKVGFFSLDHASQTEVTEIVDLKEMTEVIQTLLQDVANLRKDIKFTKLVMQADHDSKLQAKSMELYCRINEKVMDLEKTHQDRVNCLRKAYRQQLVDAVAKLSVHFDKNLQSKMVRERTKQKSDLASKEKRFREMQATILHNEGVIQMLKTQLQQYRMKQDYDDDDYAEDRFMDRRFSMDERSPRVDSALQEQLTTVQEELAEVIQKLETSEKKSTELEQTLSVKDEEIKSLYKEIDSLKEQLESADVMVEKLKNEQNEMADVVARENETNTKIMGHQKDEMKRLVDEQVRLAREEAMNKMKQEAQKAATQEQSKIKQMADQIAELEKQLAKEKEKSSVWTQVSVSSRTLPGSDEKLKAEIKRLQMELEKTHRSWEKKFTILEQSMHALKDESYLRQSLQRQAAQLHQAAVSYSSDLPVGLLPTKGFSSSLKKSLPHLHRVSKEQAEEDNYISDTVSAPSDKGTAMFFHDENQIMTDNEIDMLPAGIELLPSPTIRVRRECSDESRPSTQSHLLILPSIQAK